jgi:hypothetical protein
VKCQFSKRRANTGRSHAPESIRLNSRTWLAVPITVIKGFDYSNITNAMGRGIFIEYKVELLLINTNKGYQYRLLIKPTNSTKATNASDEAF